MKSTLRLALLTILTVTVLGGAGDLPAWQTGPDENTDCVRWTTSVPAGFGVSRTSVPARAAASQSLAHSPRVTVPVHEAVWSSQEQNRDWRRTRKGWQEIEITAQPAVQYLNIPRPAPVVHPIRMTVLVLLGVLAAVAWSCDEWDWHRLTESEAADDSGEPLND